MSLVDSLTAKGRKCPVCGKSDLACVGHGPANRTDPVDLPTESRKELIAVKTYDVVYPDGREAVQKLADADVKRMEAAGAKVTATDDTGAVAAVKKRSEARNKAREAAASTAATAPAGGAKAAAKG